MNRQHRKDVASVIESNSQWVTLRQLADRGTTQVRVLQRKKVMEMMQAVVDDAIKQEVSQNGKADRQRIIGQANERFRSVSRIQAESEAIIQQQKERLAQQQSQIEQYQKVQDQLEKEIAAERQSKLQSEQTVQSQVSSLQDAQWHLHESIQQQQKSDRQRMRLGRRLAVAQETIRHYDQEVDRLVKQMTENAALIEALRSRLHGRESELDRMKNLMETLDQELVQVRQQSTKEPESIQTLRDQLADVKHFLVGLKDQNNQVVGSDIEAMLERMIQKESAVNTHLESRLDNKLDEAFTKIDKTLRSAVVIRHVDGPVNATDVVISKIFDDEDEMESNLEALDIQTATTKKSISDSLDRLKQLRGQAAQVMNQESEQQSGDQTET